MFIILLMLVLALAGVFVAKDAYTKTYGSSLEQYIIDNNPQHSGDVERLTVEYNMKLKNGLI